MSDSTDVSEKILNLIKESSDRWLKGSYYRSDDYLKRILFSDVMDIVLYDISLQPDLDKIARIKTADFYRLTHNIWDKWIEEKKNVCFFDLDFPWSSGPGPMDGTMGSAEFYFSLYPGPLRDDYLLEFFSYPKGLPSFNPNWPSYKEKHIERMVFPKWRRKNKLKRIDSVFTLAEMIMVQMRKG